MNQRERDRIGRIMEVVAIIKEKPSDDEQLTRMLMNKYYISRRLAAEYVQVARSKQ